MPIIKWIVFFESRQSQTLREKGAESGGFFSKDGQAAEG